MKLNTVEKALMNNQFKLPIARFRLSVGKWFVKFIHMDRSASLD
ncbi:MAG TPA: hypothetical protein VF088_08130 [Pyrinomonadaceae bacterium]